MLGALALLIGGAIFVSLGTFLFRSTVLPSLADQRRMTDRLGLRNPPLTASLVVARATLLGSGVAMFIGGLVLVIR